MLSISPMPMNERTTSRLLRSVVRIEETISESMTLADLAGIAALSEYHFHRLFRARFGVSVMDYVRRRRLAVAAQALLATRSPVLHIAFDAGFQSQAAFTRAFRKIYHTTPALYRTRARDVPWLSAAPISAEALVILPGLGSDQPRVEWIESFTVDGLSLELDGASRTAIPQLWERLVLILGPSKFHAAEKLGLSAGNEAILEGVLRYCAAIRVDAAATSHPNLERQILPGGPYLVFRFVGETQRIPDAYDYIFGNWLPGSSHVPCAGASFVRLPPNGAQASTSIIEICIPVRDA